MTLGLDFGSNQPGSSASFAQPIFSGQDYRNNLGQTVANISNTLGIPHIGVSDAIAGHPVTPTTGKAYADSSNSSNTQNYSSAPNYSPAPSQLQQLAAIGNGNRNPVQETQYQQLLAAQDPYAGVRNDISSAWDSYLNSLNGVGDYLNQQQTAQQGVADTQLQQGQNAINQQKASSLKDIASTTRNAFAAGNNYLGALGAGDSSAANQYSFAINQQANKQTGDLNNFVNSKLQDLQSTHDSQIQQIASWFAQQQAALKQQIAQGGLQKGQDIANLSKGILDQAIAATNQLKANTQNQYNALLTWAANNSQNFGQLQQNIAQIPQAMGQLQTFGQGQTTPVFGGTPASNQRTDIFGNPIQ